MKDFEDSDRASLSLSLSLSPSLSLSQSKLFPAAYPKSDYGENPANG